MTKRKIKRQLKKLGWFENGRTVVFEKGKMTMLDKANNLCSTQLLKDVVDVSKFDKEAKLFSSTIASASYIGIGIKYKDGYATVKFGV